MRRHRPQGMNIRVRSGCGLFIAILSIVFLFAGAAQPRHIAEFSTESSEVPVPIQASLSTPVVQPSGAGKAQRHPATPRDGKAATNATGPKPGGSLFLPPVMYDAGGSYDPVSVAVADVNGDGKPDLIVASQTSDRTVAFAASTVSVLLGNGDGTFQTGVTYASGGSYLNFVAVADVNHDGKLDILAANGCSLIGQGICSVQGAIGVLLGNGDGTFQPAVNYSSGGFGIYNLKVAVVDVNGDGNPDLVTLNGCSSPCDPIGPPEGSVGVLLGNGDGTFRAPVPYLTGGYFAGSLAAADLNGNGTVDLVVTNYCGDNNIGDCTTPGPVDVLLGNGDGTFKAAVAYASGGQGTASVAIKDVNGDGKPDLVVANCGSGGCGSFWPPPAGGVVSVLLGNGDGSFNPAMTYGSGSYYVVAVGDVDGNGEADIVVANWACSSSFVGCVSVFLGNGDGAFQAGLSYALGTDFSAIALADVNGDGKVDLLATPAGNFGTNTPPSAVGVLLNGGGSTQSPTTTTLSSSLNPSVYGQTVTWTATVTTTGSVPPTGKVNFTWSIYTIGSATLNASGVATLTKSNLNADTYPLTAVYVGDPSNLRSTSSVVSQVVTQATSSAKLSSSPNPSEPGQAVTFTATITSPTAKPTGPVTFTVGKTVLGTAQLIGGKAKFTTTTLAAGSTTVTATFDGDSDITASSASVTQIVGQSTIPPVFVMPFNGRLYLLQEGGSASASTDFGLGTSPTNFAQYYGGLPNNPNPVGEVMVGYFTAGTVINFGMFTVFGNQSGWAFSTGTDEGSIVAFTDIDDSLGMGGSITQQTSSTTWLLHLDDALSYLYDDDDNDVLMQIRVAPGTPQHPTVSPRSSNVPRR